MFKGCVNGWCGDPDHGQSKAYFDDCDTGKRSQAANGLVGSPSCYV